MADNKAWKFTPEEINLVEAIVADAAATNVLISRRIEMGRLLGETLINNFAFNIIPQTLYKMGLKQLELQQGLKVAFYSPQQCNEVYRQNCLLIILVFLFDGLREVAGIDETNIDGFITTFCVSEQKYGNLLALLQASSLNPMQWRLMRCLAYTLKIAGGPSLEQSKSNVLKQGTRRSANTWPNNILEDNNYLASYLAERIIPFHFHVDQTFDGFFALNNHQSWFFVELVPNDVDGMNVRLTIQDDDEQKEEQVDNT